MIQQRILYLINSNTSRLRLTAQIGLLFLITSPGVCQTKIRVAPTLPAHCNPGLNNTAADMIATRTGNLTTFHVCTDVDNWDDIITTAVALSWSASVGADTYNVYRANVTGGPYIKIQTVTDTNFTDMNVNHNTTYYYVVTAENVNGESGFSNETNALTRR